MRRPLLAAKTTDADLQRLIFPLLLSPKIDGIRALVVNGRLVSRSMKLIPNSYTQKLFGKDALNGLDGELVVGEPTDKQLMQQTTSGVMSYNGQPDVKYYIFDNWQLNTPFYQRLQSLRDYDPFLSRPAPNIIKLDHHLVENLDEVLELEAHYLTLGYEGVMLRDPNGRYKEGRSTLKEGILLKVKRFCDSEAVVLGYELLEKNLNGQTLDERGYSKRSTSKDGKLIQELLGSLVVHDIVSKVIFSIGSGFTLAQREELYHNREKLAGQLVKYKSFPVGVKDKPRFPIFISFRSPLDLSY